MYNEVHNNFGWFSSHKLAKEYIEIYEEGTRTHFINRSSDEKKDFTKCKIMWHEMPGGKTHADGLCHIQYDGVPYIFVKSKRLECEFGRYRETKRKPTEVSDDPGKRRRNCIHESKKRNCPAFIYLREIWKFPQYKIDKDAVYQRRSASKRLRKAITETENVEDVPHEYRCYVQFPSQDAHNGHVTDADAGILQRVDKHIIENDPLVEECVSNVEELKQHVEISGVKESEDIINTSAATAQFGTGNHAKSERKINKATGRKAKINKICKILNNISDLIYDVPCSSVLEDAIERLISTQEELSKACTVENGLRTQVSAVKKRKRSQLCQADPLPRKYPRQNKRQTIVQEDMSKTTSIQNSNASTSFVTSVSVGEFCVKPSDFRTLQGKNWLNDTIISAYMKLLEMENDRVLVLVCHMATALSNMKYDSFLYPKVNMAEYALILMPVNVDNNHWVLLAYRPNENLVTVVDSSPNIELATKRKEKIINEWREYMQYRSMKLSNEGIIPIEYPVQSEIQTDGHSCGVFLLMNAEALITNQDMSLFNQNSVEEYRAKIRNKLLNGGNLAEFL